MAPPTSCSGTTPPATPDSTKSATARSLAGTGSGVRPPTMTLSPEPCEGPRDGPSAACHVGNERSASMSPAPSLLPDARRCPPYHFPDQHSQMRSHRRAVIGSCRKGSHHKKIDVGTANPVPSGERAIDDLIETGVPGGIVPEQDVGGAVAAEVADSFNRIGRGGAAYPMPALQDAVVDLVEAGVPGAVVPEQDVRG